MTDMAELVKMLRDRQGEMSIEEFANKMNLRGATLFRYYSGERKISLPSVRKMADYFDRLDDSEMIQALASYSLGKNLP